MEPVTIYIALGANLDPEINIRRALRMLDQHLEIEAVSPFYYSAPLCRPEQPRFLNGVLRAATTAAAFDLRDIILRRIERDLGRRRSADRHAARPIDLDIILYGDARIAQGDLVIPDPDIATRAFLAGPLLDLAPDIVLPGDHVPLAQRLADGLLNSLEPAVGFPGERTDGGVLREH